MIVESMREATRKELIERIKELEQENREIREWKYVIDNPIDLEKLKELDLIKIKGKEYISKDKIREKFENLKDKEQEMTDGQGYWGRTDLQAQIEVLEELLGE